MRTHAIDVGLASALIVGVPGSGKTRLLDEALRGIREGGRLQVTGHEPEQGVRSPPRAT